MGRDRGPLLERRASASSTMSSASSDRSFSCAESSRDRRGRPGAANGVACRVSQKRLNQNNGRRRVSDEQSFSCAESSCHSRGSPGAANGVACGCHEVMECQTREGPFNDDKSFSCPPPKLTRQP